MSKVRHKREAEPILPPDGVRFWRAKKYHVSEDAGWIEAAPGAAWRRESAATRYKPPTKNREAEGPHFSFLKLRRLIGDDFLWSLHEYRKEMEVFASYFGLLGVIHERYILPPIPPAGKRFVIPEAVLETDGKLRRVDVEEGAQLLLDLLLRQSPGLRPVARRHASDTFAEPSEVELLPRSYIGPWTDPNRVGIDPVPWEKVKEDYGVLLVLDQEASTKVSVLCTSEPLLGPAGWGLALADFPLGELRPENSYLKKQLNSRLTDISPYSPEDEEGFRRAWRCSSLLQAIRLMLWLDLTGGRFVRACGLHDCHVFFREGSQGESTLYCSPRCTSLASTRMERGQAP